MQRRAYTLWPPAQTRITGTDLDILGLPSKGEGNRAPGRPVIAPRRRRLTASAGAGAHGAHHLPIVNPSPQARRRLGSQWGEGLRSHSFFCFGFSLFPPGSNWSPRIDAILSKGYGARALKVSTAPIFQRPYSDSQRHRRRRQSRYLG